MDTGHSRLVVSTGGNALKVHRFLQWITRHIPNHTTWCRSGGQSIPCLRYYRLEAFINLRQDPSRKCCYKADLSSQSQNICWRQPRIGFNEHSKRLGNEGRGGGKKLHWMAKLHNFLEMWQGSQNLRATQKESRAQNKQITAVGYISDTEEFVKASSSLFQPDGAAAFRLSKRSP